MVVASELPIETVREGTTTLDMANSIFGNGVTVTVASFVGDVDPGNVNTANNINMYVSNQNSQPNTEIGFVNATGVPCFVAGTSIATPGGECRAEMLQPGELVRTKDDGAQPLRWIGIRGVEPRDEFAPINIRDKLAELPFGEAEVLIAARDLVNDGSVLRREGREVTYVHLMFDKHQVVFSEGLKTESFLPGPQTTKSREARVVEEICAIFPEMNPAAGQGYSPSVRRTLGRYEATLLRAAQAA